MAKRTKAEPAAGKKANSLEVTAEGLRAAAGSDSNEVQVELINQAIGTLWKPGWKTQEDKARAVQAAYHTLQRIAPRSEIEGMLAVQMIGTHNAAMECLRRAMLEEQSFEGRDQNLKHATRLMGLYERQLAALDKHRGKGKQIITVKHLNVNDGGQAIVGDVSATRAGAPPTAAQAQQAPALTGDSAASEDGENLREALSAKNAPAVKRTRK